MVVPEQTSLEPLQSLAPRAFCWFSCVAWELLGSHLGCLVARTKVCICRSTPQACCMHAGGHAAGRRLRALLRRHRPRQRKRRQCRHFLAAGAAACCQSYRVVSCSPNVSVLETVFVAADRCAGLLLDGWHLHPVPCGAASVHAAHNPQRRVADTELFRMEKTLLRNIRCRLELMCVTHCSAARPRRGQTCCRWSRRSRQSTLRWRLWPPKPPRHQGPLPLLEAALLPSLRAAAALCAGRPAQSSSSGPCSC